MSTATMWSSNGPTALFDASWDEFENMAIVDDAAIDQGVHSDPLRYEFDALAEQWSDETGDLSSTTRRFMHPAYQRIIGMGRPAIPYLLEELGERPALWFHALRAIAGEDPARPDQRGNIRAIAMAWLDWGRQHHYID